MRTIYEYPLKPVLKQTIYVPMLKVDDQIALNIKKQILKLDVQEQTPCLWIMVDDEEQKREIKVTLCGTGQQCYEPLDGYVDSVQITQNSGVNYVFHVFVRER